MSASTMPRPERNHRPGDQGDREGDDRRDQEQAAIGRGGDDGLLEEDLEPVGEALQQAERADHVGPAPQRHRRPDLAVGIDDHRHRQHQRQRDQQDQDQGGDEPAPAGAEQCPGTRRSCAPPRHRRRPAKAGHPSREHPQPDAPQHYVAESRLRRDRREKAGPSFRRLRKVCAVEHLGRAALQRRRGAGDRVGEVEILGSDR